MEKLSALPHISRVEKRYLAPGVSAEYLRLDTDKHYYPYAGRCILEGTVKYRYVSDSMRIVDLSHLDWIANWEYLTLEDVKMLAGNPVWIWDIVKKQEYEEDTVTFKTWSEDYRDEFVWDYWSDNGAIHWSMLNLDNHLYAEDVDFVQPGGRYVFILRNNNGSNGVVPHIDYQEGQYPRSGPTYWSLRIPG